jgi:glycosyltransferase involved in cell wall biosynthesis
VVLNYEYPPVGGGAGQVTEHLCRFFARRGIRQWVITGWVPGLPWLERQDRLTLIRVPMLKLRRDRTSVAGMASYLLTAAGALLLILLCRRVEMIHAHFAVPVGLLALLAKAIFGTPYAVTLHGGDVPGMVPEQTDALFRWTGGVARAVTARADLVTAVSGGLKALAAKSYPGPITVIPNGIDASWVETERQPAPPGPAVTRLIFVGRLTRQKNVDSLIRAVGLLPGDRRWRLDILGDGPLGESLRREARDFPQVHFHGWLPVARVKRLLSEADIFLLPSFAEGLSIAALQAMARGCALVVSDIPMNRDVVEEGINGFFCSHEPPGIARAIERCLPGLEGLKDGSRQRAKAFLWERIGEAYLSHFEGIGEKKP